LGGGRGGCGGMRDVLEDKIQKERENRGEKTSECYGMAIIIGKIAILGIYLYLHPAS
jgi:hypothetical protein